MKGWNDGLVADMTWGKDSRHDWNLAATGGWAMVRLAKAIEGLAISYLEDGSQEKRVAAVKAGCQVIS